MVDESGGTYNMHERDEYKILDRKTRWERSLGNGIDGR
jgi:hypothetical protein